MQPPKLAGGDVEQEAEGRRVHPMAILRCIACPHIANLCIVYRISLLECKHAINEGDKNNEPDQASIGGPACNSLRSANIWRLTDVRKKTSKSRLLPGKQYSLPLFEHLACDPMMMRSSHLPQARSWLRHTQMGRGVRHHSPFPLQPTEHESPK
jgi:hypothetical protein